jgi:hypothetical protein
MKSGIFSHVRQLVRYLGNAALRPHWPILEGSFSALKKTN